MQSRTTSDRAVPLPALTSSSDQTPIAQLGVPSATAKTSAAVNWTRLRTSNDQTRSASGNPQTAPSVATPITAALATAATETSDCADLPTPPDSRACQRRSESSDKGDEGDEHRGVEKPRQGLT